MSLICDICKSVINDHLIKWDQQVIILGKKPIEDLCIGCGLLVESYMESIRK